MQLRQHLDPADGNITNVMFQDQCWLRHVPHFTMFFDGMAYSGIADALAKRPITLNLLAL